MEIVIYKPTGLKVAIKPQEFSPILHERIVPGKVYSPPKIDPKDFDVENATKVELRQKIFELSGFRVVGPAAEHWVTLKSRCSQLLEEQAKSSKVTGSKPALPQSTFVKDHKITYAEDGGIELRIAFKDGSEYFSFVSQAFPLDSLELKPLTQEASNKLRDALKATSEMLDEGVKGERPEDLKTLDGEVAAAVEKTNEDIVPSADLNDLASQYEELYGKNPGPRYSKDKEWLIKKINEKKGTQS